MILYKNARVALDGKLVKRDFLVDNNKFVKVEQLIEANCEKIIDMQNKIVLPKLFDEHTHGANGNDFNLATLEEMDGIMQYYIDHKVGSVLPTVMTDDMQVMLTQLEKVAALSKKYSEIKGIHLEGPFLSVDYKGAMPESYLQKADIRTFDKLQKAANGLIRLITLSPEIDGAVELVRELTERNVTVNLGHSGATYEQTMACIDAGAQGFTHTFNAMKLMHQHFPNIGGAAMLTDKYCEIICDGHHLNPVTVQLLAKIKTVDQLILVTDSIMAAGLPDGEYKLGVNNVTVKLGDATITETGVRAGSTLNAIDALNNFIKWTGIPVERAILCFASNPAKHVKCFDQTGSIESGKEAEFFVYEN